MDAAADDAAAFGAPPEFVDELGDDEGGEVFEVWPENERVLRLFLDCATQWQFTMGGVAGLVYAGVESVMRIRRVKPAERGAIFDDLRVMESAAVKALNDRKK